MYVIGLTGSLATGKSTVAQMFRQKKMKIFDADQASYELLNNRGSVYKQVIKKFGKIIINQKGGINRKVLGRIVFSNAQKLIVLEKIVHPAVRREALRLIRDSKGKKSIVVLDVPLLFEAGFNDLTNINIVVKANRKIQLQRAIKRLHITRRQALARIKAQMPLKEKIRLADMIIDNSGSLKKTKEQVDKICQRICQVINQ